MKFPRFLLVSSLALSLFLTACTGTPLTSDSPQAPEPSPSEPVDSTSDAAFSGSSGSGKILHVDGAESGVESALLAFFNAYYQSLGNLEVQDCSALFTSQSEADRHKAIWHTLAEIRKASLIDLRMECYDFTVTLTQLQQDGDRLYLSATEDVTVRFLATPEVDSQQFGTLHEFTLVRSENGSWQIEYHESDDNPYYNFQYSESLGSDTRLTQFLQDIALRQSQQGQTDDLSALSWDHDYDRAGAYSYMQTWIEQRNDTWAAYDDAGGNCQNFGSQVLLAGGIPMDEVGDAQWYWYTHNDQDYSWINVGYFMDYAKANTGYGLVSLPEAAYYTGEVGDILIFGDDGLNHTTVISDVVCDESGQTVDYLVCSNTSNYRNFPASAYYYTRQWLVRILGWNES